MKLQLSFTQERIISRVCPQCGRVLEESWVSCPYCGRNLTGRQKRLGITFEIPASIASIKAKLRAVVYWSLFLFVLLASYLFSASNPHTTLYGWFIIPAVASFFVGYILAELRTAVETILACFLLHAPIIIVLLSIPLFFNSLPSSANINWQDFSSRFGYVFVLTKEAWSTGGFLIPFFLYYILNMPLSMFTSFAGTIVRGLIGPKELLFQEQNVTSN